MRIDYYEYTENSIYKNIIYQSFISFDSKMVLDLIQPIIGININILFYYCYARRHNTSKYLILVFY